MTYNKTLMLVEDNSDDEILFRRALEKYKVPCQIVVARDGVEAVDYLLRMGTHVGRDLKALPALVVLDLKMPQLDGLNALQIIRANDPIRHIPVVLFTSSGETIKSKSYLMGANSFVRKPLDAQEFEKTVGEMCLYWLELNETPETR